MDEVARGKRRARPERRHLRREVRTALELAIVALAPPKLIEQLAMAAGLLEALEELPSDTAPVRDLADAIAGRAGAALDAWHEWRPNRIPEPA
jgi:hypothetical protein